MPKQWCLIALYMIFVYCLLLGIIQYAKRHPIRDEEQGAQEQVETRN